MKQNQENIFMFAFSHHCNGGGKFFNYCSSVCFFSDQTFSLNKDSHKRSKSIYNTKGRITSKLYFGVGIIVVLPQALFWQENCASREQLPLPQDQLRHSAAAHRHVGKDVFSLPFPSLLVFQLAAAIYK